MTSKADVCGRSWLWLVQRDRSREQAAGYSSVPAELPQSGTPALPLSTPWTTVDIAWSGHAYPKERPSPEPQCWAALPYSSASCVSCWYQPEKVHGMRCLGGESQGGSKLKEPLVFLLTSRRVWLSGPSPGQQVLTLTGIHVEMLSL